MAKQRHLNNAPILEAIIDFRTKLPSTFKVTQFALLKDLLADSYPVIEENRGFEGELKITMGKGVQQSITDKGLQGFFFKSQDRKNVAQFRQDGFTFSRLKPYTNWQAVLEDAKRLWALYLKIASPELYTRIAVRYINQLVIPLPIESFRDYLTAPPAVPENLPQSVRSFLTRVTICDEKVNIMANIIQALENVGKADNVAIFLDIDVFKLKESGFKENEIWPTFEQLHDLKNQIFFDSIQEKTARLFE